jgi:hypothetical protein
MSLHDTSDTSTGAEASALHVRIRRGSRVVGLDGDLGSVQQIVVDQETGELRGIVVQRASDGAEFELPVDLLTRATSREVRVNLAAADLDRRPDLAHPYNPDQYVAVQPGDTAPRVQATRTARDTDHPVVTSVEQDAANLIAPPTARPATDTAVGQGASSTARSDSAAQPIDLATPPSPTESSDAANAETLPRHDAARADLRAETTEPAPPRSDSATPGVTGQLIGGKPSTGGMGAASAVPGSTVPSQDTSLTSGGAPATASPSPSSTTEDDLSDLTDDELSNPDAALINPRPGAEDRIARPFNNASPSADDTATTRTQPTEQDRLGMQAAFSTATNTSADDTYVDRGPDLLVPDLAGQGLQAGATSDEKTLTASRPATGTQAPTSPDAADLIEPLPDDLGLASDQSDLGLAGDQRDLGLVASPERDGGGFQSLLANGKEALASWLEPAPAKAGLATAVVAGDIALRLLGARRLRAFERGALLGAALALVLAPMPGSRLRARIVAAAERIRPRAA